MVGRYSGLTSSPLSCSDSLWQVQNTCCRCTFSQASATSWKGWKHIRVKRAKLTILPCFICFIQFQPAVKEEDTTQLQMSLRDMYQKVVLLCFFFFVHSYISLTNQTVFGETCDLFSLGWRSLVLTCEYKWICSWSFWLCKVIRTINKSEEHIINLWNVPFPSGIT